MLEMPTSSASLKTGDISASAKIAIISYLELDKNKIELFYHQMFSPIH